MRTKNLLKLALTMVAMLTITSAWAQYPAAIETNYVEVADSTYQTAGKTFRLYVAPDNVYSPNYESTPTPANINANSRWTWTYGAGLSGTPATTVVSASNTNYVEFTTVNLGAYSVSVVESNSLTGCADSSPVVHGVRVVAAPTAEIAGSAVNANYTWANPSTNLYRACVPGTTGTETVTVTFTESPFIPSNLRSYAFGVSGVVENVQPDLVTADGAAISTPSFEYTIAAKLRTGNVTAGHTWTPNTVPTATSTLSFSTPTLSVLNDKPTRYTFTLVEPSDLDGGESGLVSGISHKSDYLRLQTGGEVVAGHAFGSNITVTYIVLPAPVTGPIYHVPNNWGTF